MTLTTWTVFITCCFCRDFVAKNVVTLIAGISYIQCSFWKGSCSHKYWLRGLTKCWETLGVYGWLWQLFEWFRELPKPTKTVKTNPPKKDLDLDFCRCLLAGCFFSRWPVIGHLLTWLEGWLSVMAWYGWKSQDFVGIPAYTPKLQDKTIKIWDINGHCTSTLVGS